MAKFELNRLISFDDALLLDELRRVAEVIDTPYLTKAGFDRLSRVSSSTIQKRFGGWQNALKRAGLQDRFSGRTGDTGKPARHYTDEELLAEIQFIVEKLGAEPLTIEAFNQHASMNAETVRRRFGSWWAALKKARLPISNLGKRYTADEYFENLLAVWMHYGRQPKYREMDSSPSIISAGAYAAKWGKWSEALLAFLQRVNDDTQGSGSRLTEKKADPLRKSLIHGGRKAATAGSTVADRREIPIGLRYEILKRDRFRCVLCGISPATDLGCLLHIDHIEPYSKGGRTTPENLRTLCNRCNVGKAAKSEV